MLSRRRSREEEALQRHESHEPFTEAEARSARQEMANNKAPGFSRITKEHLILGGWEMDKLVASLGDKIVNSKKWPMPFKINDIDIPIRKDHEAVNLINCDQTRPITLLEVMDKWIQRMIYNKIIDHVHYHEMQAGYCLSCDHHTTAVSDFVFNRDNKPYIVAVFTDISKAFDSIPLEEIIDAIWSSNIPQVYKWSISSFVEDRIYRVQIRDVDGNTAASDWMDKLYGTPQGSTLGPLIWNTFFDPLLVEISALASSHLTPTEELDLAFADDLTLIAASEDLQVVEQCLEEKLEVFSNFLKERGMKAAAHKMRTMTLDPFFKNFTPRVTFRGTPIQVVETHVFLGIILDNHMTFVPHWKMMCKSMEGRIQTIKALRSAS